MHDKSASPSWSLGPATSLPGWFDIQGSQLAFLDIYRLEVPDIDSVKSVIQGLLHDGAISYCRFHYAEAGMAAYVVTSTLPHGRTEAEEFSLQLQRERGNERLINEASQYERCVVQTLEGPWGPIIRVRIVDIDEGTLEAPFPVERRLLEERLGVIQSMSCHWLFANGRSRFEIAVYSRPNERFPHDTPAAMEMRLIDMGERMLLSLFALTPRKSSVPGM